MSDIFVFPYKAESKSAKALSEAMDVYRINRTNSQFVGRPTRTVINWGFGDTLPSEVAKCRIINKPDAIAKAVNKIASFQHFVLGRVSCPQFSTDRTTAQQWINAGYGVYARQRVEGHDGQGVEFIPYYRDNLPGVVPQARFYTRQVPQGTEYRLTVVGDEVICYQKKVPLSNHPTPSDPNIRTTGGGWGFEVVSSNTIPPSADAEAVAAVKALGLDFGGVDLIASGRHAYVLTVNTDPHLTPYCAEKLSEALKEYIRGEDRT